MSVFCYDSFCDYHCDDKPGNITKYAGSDCPEGLLRSDYTGPDFDYKFNSLGFRGPELDNSTPALASFGCSHTVGTGVPEEHRFATLFAKKLDLINYCFAVGGSDNLSIMRNVVAFLKNNKENTNTKLILVCWSLSNRFSILKPNSKNLLKSVVPGNDEGWEGINDLKVLWNQYSAEAYTLEFIKTVDILCKLANVKCIQINIFTPLTVSFKKITSYYDDFNFTELDKGRDRHFGILTHASIAENLYIARYNRMI